MPQITTNIDLAVHELQEGKPVAIPTETVYGLAAPINNEEAIKAVFAMKDRPLNHPLIVHIAANWDLKDLVEDIPDYAQQLMAEFWPGPLTLVFSCKVDKVSPVITGGQSTIAIRCPAHPLTQKLLNQLQIPLVAPSANPFGKISPTTAQHVKDSFPDKELTVLDGGRCTVGIESTIIDVSHEDYYQILRHGVIDEEAIAQVIATPSYDTPSSIRVPGKLDSHYQPQKTLYYFEQHQELVEFCHTHEGKVFVLAKKQPNTVNKNLFHLLSEDPEKAAFDLYFQLRRADASEAQWIVIELPDSSTSWQGVRERIVKAGFPYVPELGT